MMIFFKVLRLKLAFFPKDSSELLTKLMDAADFNSNQQGQTMIAMPFLCHIDMVSSQCSLLVPRILAQVRLETYRPPMRKQPKSPAEGESQFGWWGIRGPNYGELYAKQEGARISWLVVSTHLKNISQLG